MIAIEYKVIEHFSEYRVIQHFDDATTPAQFSHRPIDVSAPPRVGDEIMLRWSDGTDAHVVRIEKIDGRELHVRGTLKSRHHVPCMVLLIEDDERMKKYIPRLIESALEPRQISITIVDRAPDAISLLGSIRFDLIVSDYDLGDAPDAGTGADVLRYLTAEQPTVIERFVFCSASEEPRRLHPKVIDKGAGLDAFIVALQAHTAGLL